MKKTYMAALFVLAGIGAILFLNLNTSSVENDILSEVDLDTVENIAVAQSDQPSGMLDEIAESERLAVIDELKNMKVQRTNLFSATRPTDAQYVLFLETDASEVYQVHLYNSENSISFTSSNDDVSASRSYRYSNSSIREIVADLF